MEQAIFSDPIVEKGHSFLSLLGDETIYSWCATSHLMGCSPSSERTAQLLLGARHAIRQHELPVSVSRLPIFEGRIATEVLELLRFHSVAGFYTPFLESDAQLSIVDSAMRNDCPHWGRKVTGVARTRNVPHPLKWCLECRTDDVDRLGRGYWHTGHQFPTTLTCPRHRDALSVAKAHKKQWRLPHQEGVNQLQIASNLVEAANLLAVIGSSLPGLATIDMESLRRVCTARLKEIGVIHSVRRVQHDRVTRWFSQTAVAEVCRLPGLGLEPFSSGSYVPELLWRRKRRIAVQWVALWAALAWRNAEEAKQAFTDAATGVCRTSVGQISLFSDGLMMPPSAPPHVYAAFQVCDSYAEAMLQLRVSRGDVVRWLEQDPELRRMWRARLRNGKLKECRDRLVEMAGKTPYLTKHALEVKCPSEIRWMREHAPVQLEIFLKSLPSRGGVQRSIF